MVLILALSATVVLAGTGKPMKKGKKDGKMKKISGSQKGKKSMKSMKMKKGKKGKKKSPKSKEPQPKPPIEDAPDDTPPEVTLPDVMPTESPTASPVAVPAEGDSPDDTPPQVTLPDVMPTESPTASPVAVPAEGDSPDDTPPQVTQPDVMPTESPTVSPVAVPAEGGNVALRMALEAVGGEEAIARLSQLEMEATGSTFMGYEGELPGDVLATSTYERSYYKDLDTDQLRVDEVATPLFEAFVFFPLQNSSRVIDGNVGGKSAQSLFVPAGTMSSGNVAALKRQQQLFNPHLLLQNVIANPSLVSDGGETEDRYILVVQDDVSDLNLFIDKVSGVITKLETMESHPLVGDTPIVVRYLGWNLRAENGDGMSLLFPSTVRLSGRDGMLWEEMRSSVVMNPSIPDSIFDLPPDTNADSYDPVGYQYGLDAHHVVEGFVSVGFAYPYGPPLGAPEELTSGLYLITVPGGANSVLVKYSMGALLCEAGGSDIHGENLLNLIQETLPGEPLNYIVQSHHHVDHAGGVRSMVALTGADVVVGHGTRMFWRRSFASDATIRPADNIDSYTGNLIEVEENANITLVDEPGMIVRVFHTDRDPHAEDALLVVIETGGEAYIYQTDIYNGGFGFTVVVGGPEALFDAMRDIGFLKDGCTTDIPTNIISGHGLVLTIEEAVAELQGVGVDVGC